MKDPATKAIESEIKSLVSEKNVLSPIDYESLTTAQKKKVLFLLCSSKRNSLQMVLSRNLKLDFVLKEMIK
jgi:hypothetical protein